MSHVKTNILFTGATGYIGGSVLERFLNRSDATSLHINAIVRTHEKAEKLKKLGVNAVVGSHSDIEFVEKLSSEADVVIATADADNLEAAQATLRGLEKRYKATGTVLIFIHTSGTGVLAENAIGEYATELIYDDNDADQIEALPPTQLHRNVDLELVNADNQGYVKTYIILPSTVYGIASGKLVEAGIQNPYSIQIPALIDASLDRGAAGIVGKGKNLWPNVHIDEVADLYLVLYDAIRTHPATGHGREGFYFGASGEHSLYQIGEAIGKALVEVGRAKSFEPTTFTKEEIDKYFWGSPYFGSNSRCRANHSFAIGWKPKKTTVDMLESIKPEVQSSLIRERIPTGKTVPK